MKNKTSLIWIWKHTKKEMWLLLLLTVISMICASAYILPALLTRHVINVAVSGGSLLAAKSELIRCGLLLLCIIFAQLILSMLGNHISAIISGRLEMKIRREFFETLLRKNYAEISKFHSGEILNRFTSDIDVVVSSITSFLPNALSIFAKLLAGLIVVASFSGKFAIFSVFVGFVILGFALLFRPWFKKIHKAAQAASGVSRSFTQECVENIVVVKSYAGKSRIVQKLSEHMQKLYRIKLRRNIISTIAGSGVSLIFTLVYYGTLLWGAFSIVSGQMDYGTLMAFLQIVSQIQSPFLNASGLITSLYSALGSAERLMEIESFGDEKTESLSDVKGLYAKMDAICAENLSFGYDDTAILKNTTFSLPKGSMTAITGTSGTGKSTLFRLLLGLFSPESGQLYIRTSEGNIATDATTRPLFAYVPQGNLLLSGTVRENIKFINPEISDAKMEEAARAACIYDFISGLPEGFDTVIGERGSGLSEGQIQRISVARALCTDAPILLLDECTSALDSATEEALLKNIAALQTKTVLFISHKNAAFSFCDLRLTIENGNFRIVD